MKVMTAASGAFLAGLLASSAWAGPPPTSIDPSNYTVTQNVQYGPGVLDMGNVYVPANPACFNSGGGCIAPAVLIMYGDGVVCPNGTPSHAVPTAAGAVWAYAGFLAYEITYEPFGDRCGFSGSQDDLQATQLALRFMRNNAGLRAAMPGVSFSNTAIYASGTSGDAYEAMSLSYRGPGGITPGIYASLYPSMSVLTYGVLDNFGPKAVPAHPNVIPLIGAASPPTYIIHGLHDCLVNIQQSRDVLAQLDSFNVHDTMVTYDGDHEFTVPPPHNDCGQRASSPDSLGLPAIYALYWGGIQWLAAQHGITLAH